jgi:hypothetical protein
MIFGHVVVEIVATRTRFPTEAAGVHERIGEMDILHVFPKRMLTILMLSHSKMSCKNLL